MNWLEIMKNAVSEQNKLFNTVKKESRVFTDEEKATFDGLTDKITEAKTNIEMENSLKANQVFIDKSQKVVNNDDTGSSNVIVKKSEKLFKNREDLFANIVKTLKTGERTPQVQNAISGNNTIIPEEGGLTVDSELMDGIDSMMWENTVIAPLCKQLKVGAKFNGISRNRLVEDSRVDGSRYGGAVVYWPEEGGEITSSKLKIEQYETKLKKAAALIYMTDELIQDSTAMVSEIESAYPREMAYSLDDKILFGDGVGKPLGAFIAGGPVISIAKETSQTADTIVYENVKKMYQRLWVSSRKNAVWLINQDAEDQLWELEHPGDSSPLIKQVGREGAMKHTLFGVPIKVIEHAETVGDLNDIMLADFSQYELLNKKGIRKDSSIHVSFTTDQTALRFIKRVGGAPVWKAAKTPAKGTTTISTFISLASRA